MSIFWPIKSFALQKPRLRDNPRSTTWRSRGSEELWVKGHNILRPSKIVASAYEHQGEHRFISNAQASCAVHTKSIIFALLFTEAQHKTNCRQPAKDSWPQLLIHTLDTRILHTSLPGDPSPAPGMEPRGYEKQRAEGGTGANGSPFWSFKGDCWQYARKHSQKPRDTRSIFGSVIKLRKPLNCVRRGEEVAIISRLESGDKPGQPKYRSLHDSCRALTGSISAVAVTNWGAISSRRPSCWQVIGSFRPSGYHWFCHIFKPTIWTRSPLFPRRLSLKGKYFDAWSPHCVQCKHVT